MILVPLIHCRKRVLTHSSVTTSLNYSTKWRTSPVRRQVSKGRKPDSGMWPAVHRSATPQSFRSKFIIRYWLNKKLERNRSKAFREWMKVMEFHGLKIPLTQNSIKGLFLHVLGFLLSVAHFHFLQISLNFFQETSPRIPFSLFDNCYCLIIS